jgi:hypothetical protein
MMEIGQNKQQTTTRTIVGRAFIARIDSEETDVYVLVCAYYVGNFVHARGEGAVFYIGEGEKTCMCVESGRKA